MKIYFKLTSSYSIALIIPFYLLVIGNALVGYYISWTAEQVESRYVLQLTRKRAQIPKYERVCFTSYAYNRHEVYGNVRLGYKKRNLRNDIF